MSLNIPLKELKRIPQIFVFLFVFSSFQNFKVVLSSFYMEDPFILSDFWQIEILLHYQVNPFIQESNWQKANINISQHVFFYNNLENKFSYRYYYLISNYTKWNTLFREQSGKFFWINISIQDCKLLTCNGPLLPTIYTVWTQLFLSASKACSQMSVFYKHSQNGGKNSQT